MICKDKYPIVSASDVSDLDAFETKLNEIDLPVLVK
jgi:biotin carboxylase